MTDQLHAFNPDYQEPVDLTTCVDRMPGTPDAACLCNREPCLWPFCTPNRNPQPEPEKETR